MGNPSVVKGLRDILLSIYGSLHYGLVCLMILTVKNTTQKKTKMISGPAPVVYVNYGTPTSLCLRILCSCCCFLVFCLSDSRLQCLSEVNLFDVTKLK